VTDAELLAEGRRRYEAGDVADAEPLARRALELRPEDGPARAEALQLVAEIEYGQGRYADAQQTAEAARRLRDGSGAEALAETDNLLGIIAVARGDVPAALPLLEGALAARERALGQDAADTIESLNNLAAAIARDGRIEEAIALNRDALARW
jgi:tetratricopeptide (TPR) repeat protein